MNKFFKRIISMLIISLIILSYSPIGNIETIGFNVNAAEKITPIIINDYAECNIYGTQSISLFSTGVYSESYGEQLNTQAKEMYDNFVKYYVTEKNNGANKQTLLNSYTFDTTHTNGNINKNDEYENTTQTVYYDFYAAMCAFLYDYPEVFWFRGMKIDYQITGQILDNKAKCYISDFTFTPNEIVTGYSSKIAEFDSAVEEIYSELKAQFTKNTPLKTKLKVIHDYICEKSYYSYSGAMVDLRVHSPAPFFIGDGGIVCEGYAKVFKILCDKFGIHCACISGDAFDNNGEAGPHMWNYVKMDDEKWYLVDITWDDQNQKIYYNYFIACANTMGFNQYVKDERIEDGDFSGEGFTNFFYPVLSSTEYQEYIQNIYGDVNHDGVADVRDLVRLKKILVGICESNGTTPDVNADGFIDAIDLNNIRNIIL